MLNTNELKPHLSKYWCIPKQNDPAFVANMEDVLGIYQRPYCKNTPVVCMDEKLLQLLDEIRESISAKLARIDPDTQIPMSGYCEKLVLNMSDLAPQAYLCLQSRPVGGGMYMRLNAVQKAITQKWCGRLPMSFIRNVTGSLWYPTT